MGHTALGAWQNYAVPLHSLHSREQSSLPGIVPPSDSVDSKSVVGIKPGDSSVMIGYQVDEVTYLVGRLFDALSHTYPALMVSRLTHFPLEQGCED